MEKAPCSSRYSLPPACGWPVGHFSHTLHLPPSLAWARAKACLLANTARPFKNGGTISMSSNANTTESNVATLPPTPKTQTSKEVIAANVKLLIEQLEAGHS